MRSSKRRNASPGRETFRWFGTLTWGKQVELPESVPRVRVPCNPLSPAASIAAARLFALPWCSSEE
jgi:hypothetical protein